jgi:uncharacterized membrane protein
MARHFSFRPSFTLRGRESYGIRGWAGKPIHPMLTDFPIVGYVLAATFTVIAYFANNRDAYVASSWVMVAALGISVLTASTGLLDWPATTRGTQARRTVNAHASVMVTATLIAAGTVALRIVHGTEPGIFLLPITGLTVLVALLIALGMWIGNDLVFEHGFRVEPARNTPAWDPSERDILPGGQAVDPRRWHWDEQRRASYRPAPVQVPVFDGNARQAPQPDGTQQPQRDGPRGDANGASVPSTLRELSKLRDEGVITPTEFELKKKELLVRL